MRHSNVNSPGQGDSFVVRPYSVGISPSRRPDYIYRAVVPERKLSLRDGTATYQMASAVVDWIVFRLSVFFLGKVREPGDRPEESRRHAHSRGSITWTSKLSAGPGTVGECRFWTGVGAGETSGIAAGYRRRQSRYGLRLAGLVDSLLAGKRLLFAGW